METFSKIILFLLLALFPTTLFSLQIPLKELVRFKGSRKNRISGYGLVTGLNGSGDKSTLTQKMAKNFFKNMGLKEVTDKDATSKNMAAVMVTANLDNFTRSGDNFDVTVSSMADAKSLKGGILLPTILKGGNGVAYAQAQGPLNMGNLTQVGGGANKSHETVARVMSGGILERDFPYDFHQYHSHLGLVLKKPDFTTNARIVSAINNHFDKELANSMDSAFIRVTVPRVYHEHLVDFISQLENLLVSPSEKAKVVVNEKTGTVVFGQNVKILPTILSHGDLQIKIGEPDDEEKTGRVIPLTRTGTVKTLVDSLNAIGTTPKDLMAILQALKVQGALKAELVIF
ncbi:flagellar basal body P-ring protein FlgI [Candidatus Riflebacteria bacterium]